MERFSYSSGISMTRSDEHCSSHSTGSSNFSSSLPLLPVPLEVEDPKLCGSQVLVRERDLCSDHLAQYTTRPAAHSGAVGPIFSSDSDIIADFHFSSVSSKEGLLDRAPYISRSSNNNISLPSEYSSHSLSFQSQVVNDCTKESDAVTWNTDSIQEFLDFTENISDENFSIRSGSAIPSGNPAKQTEWSEWMNNDDSLGTNWSELLVEAPAADSGPRVLQSEPKPANSLVKQPQVLQSIPLQSREMCIAASPPTSSSNTQAKQRMRWTPEKHERFVQSVNQLGGCEKATPKAVLKLMNYDDMTIYHVKSHLQKYRTARYRPEPSEGASEKKNSISDGMPSLEWKMGMSLTEALRLQMEVQKQLHEQLEVQRKLQLQIEEQGQCLLMMYQKQCKDGSSNSEPPLPIQGQSPGMTSNAALKEASEIDKTRDLDDRINAENTKETLNHGHGKQKLIERDHRNDLISNGAGESLPPQAKRSRIDDSVP